MGLIRRELIIDAAEAIRNPEVTNETLFGMEIVWDAKEFKVG